TAVSYPIAPITGGLHLPEAQRFIGFVLSTEGQGILARYGFVQP
ncbi:MAG: substrate-binding domain-containing protein, partial [Burkholderiales bacterium]|nr:substrate-binding domain-containing protein [Burkholderiales bacterium]